jgi:hypothetical protein
LKVPFAGPRHFYENLKQRPLPKIRTIDARRGARAATASRKVCEAVDLTQSRPDWSVVRRCRTHERIVHHATDRSPFNRRFTIPREWIAGRAQIRWFGTRKYRCPTCLSVRLSGV